MLGSLKSGSAKLRQKLSSSEICLEKDLHKLMETHETIYSFFFRLFLFQKSKEAQKFILPVSLYFVVSDQEKLNSQRRGKFSLYLRFRLSSAADL